MTDPATHPATLARYARGARRALAEAHTATLLVEGLGRVAPDPAHVLLDDREGRPRFTCSVDSPIVAAAKARCPAILDVVAAGSTSLGAGSVIFAGHLVLGAPADGEWPGDDSEQARAAGDPVQVVELRLVSVVVETDDPRSHSLVARRIPLDVYAADGGSPDAAAPVRPTLEEVAETMRVHTNAQHADRLRSCAAARAGLDDAHVIAAQLVAVATDGATLDWLDVEGGHTVRLGFPRPAADGPQLAALLRAQLCAHRECS